MPEVLSFPCDKKTAMKLAKKALGDKMPILSDDGTMMRVGTPPLMVCALTFDEHSVTIGKGALSGTIKAALEVAYEEYSENNDSGAQNSNAAAPKSSGASATLNAQSSPQLRIDEKLQLTQLLKTYKELLDIEAISQEEFDEKKKEVLEQLSFCTVANNVPLATTQEENNERPLPTATNLPNDAIENDVDEVEKDDSTNHFEVPEESTPSHQIVKEENTQSLIVEEQKPSTAKENEAVVIDNQTSEKSKNQNSNIFRIITLGGLLIALLLIIVGIFGTVVKADAEVYTGYGITASVGLKYYFHDAFEYIKELQSQYTYPEYPALATAMILLRVIVFYISLVCVFLFSILIIFKYVKQKKISFSLFNAMSCVLSFHLGLTMLLTFMSLDYSYSENIKGQVLFGWGSILLIVGISIGLFVQIINGIYSARENTRQIVDKSLYFLSLVLLFVLLLVSFGGIVSVTGRDYMYAETITYCSYYPVSTILASFSSDTISELPSYFSGFLTAFILLLVSLLGCSLSFLFLALEKKKTHLIFSIFSFVLGLTGAIISTIAFNQSLDHGSVIIALFGPGPIILIVFSVVIIASFFGSYFINKKAAKENNQ